MRIHPLSEGEFTIGFDKVFLPFNSETDVLADRPKGSLLVEVQPFLIELGDELIVLDTGLGFDAPSGRLQIHEALERLGYGPGDVTHVLLSHLHKDHAGGLLWQDENGAHRPVFPYALHTIRRSEWDYAQEKGYPSYHPDDFSALPDHVRIQWLEGECGDVMPGIQWEHSGGHCPQHVVYTLTDGDETAFFGGDEAPELRQFRMKYAAKYDWDPKRAMELRETYAERGRTGNWQFLFYHDIKSPVARL